MINGHIERQTTMCYDLLFGISHKAEAIGKIKTNAEKTYSNRNSLTLKIKPDDYPMAYPLDETIGICDTGNINDPEELDSFIHILTHEYLHILLFQLESDEANICLDNLNI